ncbi:NADH-quinone oxidoreductase subunit I, partial [Striga asiatica]
MKRCSYSCEFKAREYMAFVVVSTTIHEPLPLFRHLGTTKLRHLRRDPTPDQGPVQPLKKRVLLSLSSPSPSPSPSPSYWAPSPEARGSNLVPKSSPWGFPGTSGSSRPRLPEYSHCTTPCTVSFRTEARTGEPQTIDLELDTKLGPVMNQPEHETITTRIPNTCCHRTPAPEAVPHTGSKPSSAPRKTAAPVSVPSLFSGSFTRSPRIRSRAWKLTIGLSGNLRPFNTTFARVSSLHDPLNGVLPYRSSYSKTPNVHQSTELPCPSPLMISGAKYSWVPTNELDRALERARAWASACSLRARAAPGRIFGPKQESWHEGPAQKGSMQLEPAHGPEMRGGSRDGPVDLTRGEVEIREHDVAVFTDEDVFGLEVSVDYAEHVKVLEGEKDLGYIESARTTNCETNDLERFGCCFCLRTCKSPPGQNSITKHDKLSERRQKRVVEHSKNLPLCLSPPFCANQLSQIHSTYIPRAKLSEQVKMTQPQETILLSYS